MRDRLSQALRAADAEYADIRIEDVESTRVIFRGPDLDNIGSSRTSGGIVRALVKGGWGYATFNDLEDLEKRVKEACESARLVGRSESHFSPVAPEVDETPASLVRDFRQVPLAEKEGVVEEYNKIVLGAHPKIQTSNVGYLDSFKKIWFANSEGSYLYDEQPEATVFVRAVARDGDIVQMGSEQTGGRTGFQVVEGFQAQAAEAAKRAVALLTAPVVTGGKYTIVADPVLTGVFAHEAFGHLSESDFVYESERMQELMTLGKRFGSEMLNIIDDGSLQGQRGTHKYDNEGVPMHENYLIKDGILVGRLHSRETAAKMGEPVTGNARSISYEHPPIVRMTNTYIDKGSSTFEEMIKDIKLGIYAIDAFGGQTSAEMFTFSAGYAHMIRDGQVAEMVRDVVLTGNVFEILMAIDALSNKVEWAPTGAGGCGKGGQFPLPVGLGGPHTRIQGVVVGGKQ